MENSTQTWILTAHCPSVSGTVGRRYALFGERWSLHPMEIQSFDDRATGQFFIRIEFIPAEPDF
ncbi:hypothetical protein P4S64_16025 [Vibrio sp. M60_M31a]